MRIVLQRVKQASVVEKQQVVASIGRGILVLFGVHQGDTKEDIPWLARKMIDLRIFPDENGKMNLSLQEIGGEILIVSQFTLYGDCSKGRRPAFVDAMEGSAAEKLYEEFIHCTRQLGAKVATGIFGAKMEVSLINDGPVTLIVDAK